MSFESAAQRTSGYAIASLVLGVAGFFGFPIVAAILAIVFGHKARKEIRGGMASGDGLATAGIILGWGRDRHERDRPPARHHMASLGRPEI